MSLAIIIGSGVLSLLCLYFSFELDDNHFLLKLLLLFFGLIFMFMIAVGVSQSDANCETLVTNTTMVNNTTSYSYDRQCHPDSATSNINLIMLTGALFMIFAIYIVIYTIKQVFDSRNFNLGKR